MGGASQHARCKLAGRSSADTRDNQLFYFWHNYSDIVTSAITLNMPPTTTAASSSKLKASKSVKGKAAPSASSITDIDSIFAQPSKLKSAPASAVTTSDSSSKSKGKKRAIEQDVTPSQASTVRRLDEKKKKKKKSKQPMNEETSTAPAPEVSRVVEVMDTSIPKIKETPAPAVGASGKGGKTKKQKVEADEDEMFADSRGTGPRALYLVLDPTLHLLSYGDLTECRSEN